MANDSKNYEIDRVDRLILSYLQKDARTPFLEIARDIGVSGGTIHQRVDRMKQKGIITGSRIDIDTGKLGYDITALVGVHLNKAQDYNKLVTTIETFPEVVEAHYTTGNFAIFVKIVTKDMPAFYEFMTKKLQQIPGVRSTESFMCLQTPIQRQIEP